MSETAGMYERFTDRARKVMQLANQEAQRFNHEYIGTEHILLGLVKEGSGVAANVLKNLDIDLRKVRLEVEKIVQTGPGGGEITVSQRPHTPRARKVIEYAVEEAHNLNHNYVGTEHLLLGLLREEEGVAGRGQGFVNGAVPPWLRDCRVVALHVSRLWGDSDDWTEASKRVHAVFNEVRRAKNVILFVPDLIATLWAAGGGLTARHVHA